MDRRYTQIAATLFATFSSQALVQQAHAQSATDAAVLPEINVTEAAGSDFKVDKASSTKFTAPILDTPKSITVITSEVMSQTGSATLVEALRTTPGITFGAGEGGNPTGDRPFIRGFDAQSSTYVDGMRDLGSQSREVFNLESVEVIRGSSSTFGGGGAVGGSLNLVSKAPLKEELRAGSVAVGTDNYKRVTADGNFVLSDTMAFRLNAMYHDADVAGRDAVSNSRWGIAPSLTFGMNTPTRVNLSYYHMQTDDLPDSGIPYNNPTLGRGDGQPVNVNRNNFYGVANRDFRKTQADIFTVRVDHDISSTLHFRNTTRFSKSSNDYIMTQPDDSKGNIYNGMVWRRINSRVSEAKSLQNQSELFGEVLTGSVKHSFSTGLELSREEGTRDSYLVNTKAGAATACAVGSGGAANNYNCTSLYSPNPYDPWTGYIGRANKPANAVNTTISLYAFDTMELSKQWSVNAGVRYDNYRASSEQGAYPAVAAADSPTGVAINAVNATNLRNKSSFFNYQAGVVYKPAENGSIYASYSTSSNPVGLNANDGADGALSTAIQSLDPERSKTYELGTKWDVLDKKVLLTAAIFRTQKVNARVTAADGTTQLAGDYTVDGIELGVAGNLTKNWQVFGGYTFLDSEIVNGGGNAAGLAVAGKQFPNTPRSSYSLWTTYAVMPKLTIGGGAFYTSRVYGNTANTKWVPSYTRFDAMASYVIDKNITLQLNVQNLTDKVYFNQAYSSHYASIAPGRSAVLALNVKY
ncbi:TonB-dependent receptor [Herminiimonas arsenitoxidans]|uniref:TonB-dependent receptor n=1 Tax=Herminiimonas arsenitoxidans TaxID=1809410 RepID=UPI0009F9AA58|nr:TonB-dependent siderophore receptor [Herminiimonas arsenitoxidans]